MFDAIAAKAPGIPVDAEMVAGYVDGAFAWSAADWARFPRAVLVEIACFASTNLGQVLDVEKGNATPAQAPAWVHMRRAAGCDPTVYCSLSNWPTVKAAFATAGIAEPHWWVADYSLGQVPQIPAGAVALQYTDNPPASPYDTSVVADYWPGVDSQEVDMQAAYRAIVALPTDAPVGTGEAQYLIVPDPGYKVWIDQESLPGLLLAFPDPPGGIVNLSAEFAARFPTLGPDAPGYTGTPYGTATGGANSSGGGAAPAAVPFSVSLSGTATPA